MADQQIPDSYGNTLSFSDSAAAVKKIEYKNILKVCLILKYLSFKKVNLNLLSIFQNGSSSQTSASTTSTTTSVSASSGFSGRKQSAGESGGGGVY